MVFTTAQYFPLVTKYFRVDSSFDWNTNTYKTRKANIVLKKMPKINGLI